MVQGRYERQKPALTFWNVVKVCVLAGLIGVSIGVGIVTVLNAFGV